MLNYKKEKVDNSKLKKLFVEKPELAVDGLKLIVKDYKINNATIDAILVDKNKSLVFAKLSTKLDKNTLFKLQDEYFTLQNSVSEIALKHPKLNINTELPIQVILIILDVDEELLGRIKFVSKQFPISLYKNIYQDSKRTHTYP